jgi:hypothetical protein
MGGLDKPAEQSRKKERWPGEEQDIENERQKLREEIDALRRGADDREARFEEIARGRAEINYGKHLMKGKT